MPDSPLSEIYDPNDPAVQTVSRTEAELAQLDARRLALLARKDAEDAAKAASTPHIRALAVALHNALCPSNHAALACTWETDAQHSAPEAADWTEPAHARWLGIAQMGVYQQMAAGWHVYEPTQPALTQAHQDAIAAEGWFLYPAGAPAVLTEAHLDALVAAGWTVTPPPGGGG
jgi:hypothetical protein